MEKIMMNGCSAFLLPALLLLMGCSVKPFIIVQQPAANPSFTVIAADGEKGFPDKIEREIIRLGLKVVERPPYKFSETGLTKTDSSGVAVGNAYVAAASGQSITKSICAVDIVAMYPDCKSDYIVAVSGASRQIRIIKKEDSTVIASGTIPENFDGDSIPSFILSTFSHAGFVKEQTKETVCEEVSRKTARAYSPY